MGEPAALRFFRGVGSRFHASAVDTGRHAPAVPVTRVAERSVTAYRGQCGVPGERPAGGNASTPNVAAGRDDNAAEIVSALLGCWPEPWLAVASRAGVTKVELDAWLARKGTLADDVLSRLMSIFGLTYPRCERAGEAADSAANAGHYMLFAGNSPERVTRAYAFVTAGDPDAASVELIPAGRTPEHRWRYLLILRGADIPSLICFPRVGRSAQLLELGRLARFHGQFAVSADFYEAVQALRADVEQRPTRVLHAMRTLHRVHAGDIARIHARLKGDR
ncbi:hypothetical protein [Paraburkholderia caffeinilytica]|uniref:hypothetical protein n=1 Tax=Paraburkholderia caffeinilytica TaxID=1761016 RepID=UPI0038BA37E5